MTRIHSGRINDLENAVARSYALNERIARSVWPAFADHPDSLAGAELLERSADFVGLDEPFAQLDAAPSLSPPKSGTGPGDSVAQLLGADW